MELWPPDLPQLLLVNGYSLNIGDPSIRSNPSVGPSKVRPRSSAVSQPLNGGMYMTTAQLKSLKTFYQVAVRGSDVFIFPDPERDVFATYAKSIDDVLTGLNLKAALKLLLDAGSSLSWPGAGTSWLDVSGFHYDFFLGTDGTVSANDPTFNGNVGDLNLNQFWAFDGGDWFTYDANNEPWMTSFHQDSAKFAIQTTFYAPSIGVQHYFCGDANSQSQIGFAFYITSTNKIGYYCANGSGVYAFAANSTIGITAAGWHTVAIIVDEAANLLTFVVDGVTETHTCTFSGPSVAGATNKLQLGDSGSGPTGGPTVMQMHDIMMWQGAATPTAANLVSLYNSMQANFAAPLFPYLNCRFTGAPTIQATTAPGCWTVGLPMEVIP